MVYDSNTKEKGLNYVPFRLYTCSPTCAYSLSTPGSRKYACPMIRMPEAPTNQKRVPKGDDIQRRGIPMTNKPVYKCFWVMLCSPICVASGAGRKVLINGIRGEGEELDAPNLLIAANPKTRKKRESRSR